MIFTNDYENLPTLVETVEILKKAVKRLPIRHLMPYDTWRNGDKEFQLNRTQLRYAIKPNIFHHPCLFSGSPELSLELIHKYSREEFLIQNLRYEDFVFILESHPFYRLLRDGFGKPNARRKDSKEETPPCKGKSIGLSSPSEGLCIFANERFYPFRVMT